MTLGLARDTSGNFRPHGVSVSHGASIHDGAVVHLGPRLRWAFVVPMWAVTIFALVYAVKGGAELVPLILIAALCAVAGTLYARVGRLTITSTSLVYRRVTRREVALTELESLDVAAWHALGGRVCPVLGVRGGSRLVMRELAELDSARGRAEVQRVLDAVGGAAGLPSQARTA